jgi:hypothetical protein
MMTEVERIADQLRRAVEGEAWHGPALLEVLEGMTAEEAALRTSSAHTVWEIVLHIAAWMSASRRRVQGEAVSLAPEEDWPAADVPDETAWSRLRAGLEGEYRALLSAGKLFQGPIADALTHVGQIAMLRRISGSPIRGENYLLADIVAGRVGPDHAPPRREFD